MAYPAAEITAALLGAAAIIGLSAYSSHLSQIVIGLGTTCVYLLLFYVAWGNINISLFLAMSVGIALGTAYPWIIGHDFYSAFLLVAVAMIGIILLAIFISTCVQSYSATGQIPLTDLFRQIASTFQTIQHALE